MNSYRLIYARLVIFEIDIQANTSEEAWMMAAQREIDGRLGFYSEIPDENDTDFKCYIPFDESTVREVEDYDAIWELERIQDDPPDDV